MNWRGGMLAAAAIAAVGVLIARGGGYQLYIIALVGLTAIVGIGLNVPLGLAPKLTEELYDLIAELRDEGTTILLVDQMAALALSVADRVYVLQSGAVKHSGSALEMRQDPALVKAYLGDHELVS